VQWGEELLPIFKAKYDLLLGEMAGNQPAPMVAHRRIGERAYETTFANGCRVAVDYATGKLWRDEREVAIPPVFDARLSLRTQ